MKKVTAIELLKTFAASTPAMIPNMGGVLRKFFEDKGFNPFHAVRMAKQEFFGQMLLQLVLRDEGRRDASLFDFQGSVMSNTKPTQMAHYVGSGVQNAAVDRALANSGHRSSQNRVQGEGATSYFQPSRIDSGVASVLGIDNTPIAIVGQGAAGILIAHALYNMGFHNVLLYEKSRRSLGIWSQDNVSEGTKNNPRAIEFFDGRLDPAPGSGRDVQRFLQKFVRSARYETGVTSITPGNLDHIVDSDHYGSRTFPIVINAIGLGKPKPLSDKTRMVTTAGASVAGPRWQQQLEAQDVRGKRLVFIGLGNSTAEMIRQMHTFMDDGVDTDYRVLTHYPMDSVWNPRAYVEQGDKMFRVFRDLSKLNLVDYQGDLQDSLVDYNRALYGGKILSGVRRWEAEGNKLATWNRANMDVDEIEFDQIYSLIGYTHSEENITRYGCKYDPVGKCAMYDYDGEFVADPKAKGGDRLFKGYFGFGSILESPHNPNAIVIPGMLHRIGDLMFGVLMRALEYKEEQEGL